VALLVIIAGLMVSSGKIEKEIAELRFEIERLKNENTRPNSR
jgi:uncharacterized small protein (DUF1192 family)